MPSVLFICTANRFRSPIAKACFHSMLVEKNMQSDWQVSSAGTWTKAGLAALPSAEWSRDQLGLDLTGHSSQPVSKELLAAYDVIVVMERNQKESLGIEFPAIRQNIFLLSQLSSGLLYDIQDPVKAKTPTQESYLTSAREIISLVSASFEAICAQAERNGPIS